MLKLEGGQMVQLKKAFAVAGDNSWEFISVDLSDCGGEDSGDNRSKDSGEVDCKLLGHHWGTGPSAPAGNTFYIDDVAYDVGPIIPEPHAQPTEYQL